MRVLSVDIGTKNLGLCIAESAAANTFKVLYADVKDIDGGTIRETIDKVIELIESLLKDHAVDRVLIEQQPLKHARMLSVMYGLYGAMKATGRETVIVSPRLRVGILGLPKEHSYHQRKKAAVAKVRELFGEVVFQASAEGKKLDDVADAILQAVVWMQRQ